MLSQFAQARKSTPSNHDDFYLTDDGKLSTKDGFVPNESAGYVLYSRGKEGQVKIMLFQRYNTAKERFEYELGPCGKSDFGVDLTQADWRKAFLARYNDSGQETIEGTTRREGFEETDEIVCGEPTQQAIVIETTPHKCWCDDTKEIKTQIGIIPRELTQEEQAKLGSKKLELWTAVVPAELRTEGEKFGLYVKGSDGKEENLLTKDNLKARWRTFSALLLKFYDNKMNEVFSSIPNPELKSRPKL